MKKKRKGKKRKRERGRRWPEWGLLVGVVVARGAGGGGRWLGTMPGRRPQMEEEKKKRNEKKRKEKEKKKKGIDGVMDGRGINEGG